MVTSIDRPTFSLVFLTWNAEDCIGNTLDSVRDQTYDDYDVIIVDNASEDRTTDIVQDYEDDFPLTLIENDRNLGFTDGINRGIEATNGEYICCYNHDTVFPPDYLKTVASYVSPDAVWTTARENHRVSTEHQTVRLLDWQRYAVPYVVDSLPGIAEVNFVPGDGAIIPRSIYEEELNSVVFRLPAKGEDVDLSLRLSDAGIPMYAILDTYSVHPDAGIYDPTFQNLKEHLVHAQMRYRSFKLNGHSYVDLLSVVLSVVTIPLAVYLRQFPRPEPVFEDSTVIIRSYDLKPS